MKAKQKYFKKIKKNVFTHFSESGHRDEAALSVANAVLLSGAKLLHVQSNLQNRASVAHPLPHKEVQEATVVGVHSFNVPRGVVVHEDDADYLAHKIGQQKDEKLMGKFSHQKAHEDEGVQGAEKSS